MAAAAGVEAPAPLLTKRTTWETQPLWWVAFACFVCRLLYILLDHQYLIPEMNGILVQFDFFTFGYETGSIAHSVFIGHGFSSPFGGETGPTAWIAPGYVFLVALAYKIFGLYTPAAALALLSFNSFCSALTAMLIVKIAEESFSRSVGLYAAWAWALVPYYWRWPTTWIWDMALSALLLPLVFWFALRYRNEARWRAWLIFGFLWGLCALINPSLLSFLPYSVLWPLWHLRRAKLPWFRSGAIFALAFALSIAPWLSRNYAVFGRPVFLRSNAFFELHLGNYHGSNGMGWLGKHPSMWRAEYRRYKEMGETAFVELHKKEFLKFVREYPEEFITLCWNRFLWFWDGEFYNYETHQENMWSDKQQWPYFTLSLGALWGLFLAAGHKVRGGVLYACLVFYPAAYYIIYPVPRYRHAIEPMMLILMTYLIYETVNHYRQKWFGAEGSQSVRA